MKFARFYNKRISIHIMSKRSCLIFSLLFVFFAQIAKSETFENAVGPTCPLPPPASLQIVEVSATSLAIHWSPVADAAIYKISLYDQTNQTTHPPMYTTGTSFEIEGLNTLTNNYLIGVSASACATDPQFGAEITVEYEPGFIIIVDEILQLNFNCASPVLGNFYAAGSQQTLEMPMNSQSGAVIHTKRVRIKHALNSNIFVDFLIWSDCYQRTRYYQIQSKGLDRFKDGKVIHYTYHDNPDIPFIDITNGDCDINICTAFISYFKPCLYGENTCNLPNNEWTCGSKPGFSDNIQSRLEDSDNLSAQQAASVITMPQQRSNASLSPDLIKVAPNPFNDHLRISYNLEESGLTAIELFDARGCLLSSPLPMQIQEAGEYQNDLSISPELPPGIYFLVLRTPRSTISIPIAKQ